MLESIVVSAFPGCGKSFAYNNARQLDLDCINIDALKPHNYVEEVLKWQGKHRFILVSYSANVREALMYAGISFTVVLPATGADIKQAFISRLHNAKQDAKELQAYVDFISSNYDTWMSNEFANVGHPLYTLRLNKGEYLSDKLYDLM